MQHDQRLHRPAAVTSHHTGVQANIAPYLSFISQIFCWSNKQITKADMNCNMILFISKVASKIAGQPGGVYASNTNKCGDQIGEPEIWANLGDNKPW